MFSSFSYQRSVQLSLDSFEKCVILNVGNNNENVVCKKEGNNIVLSPFPRTVIIWYICICLGVLVCVGAILVPCYCFVEAKAFKVSRSRVSTYFNILF